MIRYYEEYVPCGTKILGEIFQEVASNKSFGSVATYRLIVDFLLERSFGPDILPCKARIMELMPELDRLLLSATTMQARTLKIVLDVAKLTKVNREQESRLVYEAAFIVLYYCHIIRETESMATPPYVPFYKSYEDIHKQFGHLKEFQSVDIGELEQRKLVSFANFMKVALLLMPKPKKAHLLDLVTRISEGRSAKYITGSGQTILTARRVQIFQFESGVKPTPRPPRRVKDVFASIEEGGSLAMTAYSLGVMRGNDGIYRLDDGNQEYYNKDIPSYDNVMTTTALPIKKSVDKKRSNGQPPDDEFVFEASEILSNLSNLVGPSNNNGDNSVIQSQEIHPNKDQIVEDSKLQEDVRELIHEQVDEQSKDSSFFEIMVQPDTRIEKSNPSFRYSSSQIGAKTASQAAPQGFSPISIDSSNDKTQKYNTDRPITLFNIAGQKPVDQNTENRTDTVYRPLPPQAATFNTGGFEPSFFNRQSNQYNQMLLGVKKNEFPISNPSTKSMSGNVLKSYDNLNLFSDGRVTRDLNSLDIDNDLRPMKQQRLNGTSVHLV